MMFNLCQGLTLMIQRGSPRGGKDGHARDFSGRRGRCLHDHMYDGLNWSFHIKTILNDLGLTNYWLNQDSQTIKLSGNVL